MPNYTFKNLDTGEEKDFFYSMKEVPSSDTVIIADGVRWKRIFVAPQLNTTGMKPIDPFSQKAFREKTGSMKGNLGNLWDVSKELSEKRAEKLGEDPLKKKYFDDYRKRKRGINHTAELAEGHKKAKKDFEDGVKKIGKKLGID